ncbi:MAG TPA: T9SS type A sorting domain-containing protein, partial [Chitinophagaceae bacterium]|nr:T9SS type A sorting domain-containing protein [Chitinophagaceae bacterium]
ESSLPGVQAQLTDLAGRVIIGATSSRQLDLNTLAEGMYLLTLTDQDGKQISVQKVNKVK